MKTFREATTQHLEYLRVKNYSENTVDTKDYSYRNFQEWMQRRSLEDLKDITPHIIESYQKYLFRQRKRNGDPLSVGTQTMHLSALKVLFLWLTKKGIVDKNPTLYLEMPKLRKRLPRKGLNADELRRLRAIPDLKSNLGYRDRTMIELMLSSGLRRFECCNLTIEDIDLDEKTVHVVAGKGNVERMVVFDGVAKKWLTNYLKQIRPELENMKSGRYVFLSFRGRPLNPDTLSQHMKSLFRKAEIEKEGSAHLLRHTFSMKLLMGGADSRIVQELLGHKSLETTQNYLKLDLRQIQSVYENCFK